MTQRLWVQQDAGGLFGHRWAQFVICLLRPYIEATIAINVAVGLRGDQCWSTAMLHPTMMKFGIMDRLREMMFLCLSKFCDNDSLGNCAWTRVEKSYDEVVTSFRKKWESEPGAPVIEDIVKFWCGHDKYCK